MQTLDHTPFVNNRFPAGSMGEVLADAHRLCAQKNLDYGPNNISQAGLLGLIVRMGDKYQRILHLAQKAGLSIDDDPVKVGNKLHGMVNNEAFEDTFYDLINYSAIALLWLDGDWGKPHEEIFG